MKIGEKIKLLRKKFALTQEQLAKIIDVERSYISRIESGDDNITAEIIFKIIKAFPDISSDWLLGLKDKNIVVQDRDKRDLDLFVSVNETEKALLCLKYEIDPIARTFYDETFKMLLKKMASENPEALKAMKEKILGLLV